MRRNIVLVGLMGCGKSSIGRILSSRLGWPLRDVDAVIEKEQGRPISEIFAQDGEVEFRRMEREAISHVAADQGAIVSVGGGAFVDPANRAALKSTGVTIYLKASVETLYDRVKHSKHRPLLANADPMERLRELLAVREPAYLEADCVLETDGRSSMDVARIIITLFFPLEPNL
jgi:shikimate kinase